MQDMLCCPICGNKLRTIRKSRKLLPMVNKTANYAERTCTLGMNHTLQIFSDEDTTQVDLLKLSLAPDYSRFVMIDFINQKCKILCFKEGVSEYIDIPKMVEPDFPELEKLKEKISMFVVFS
jgi:uncharacterized protein YbaR (Trm112 family)